MAEPFAELGDLEDRWRKQNDSQSNRAITLLADASRLIRARVKDVDARIADLSLDADLVRAIVCDMVRRVLQGPADGSTSSTAQIGGTSVSSAGGVPGMGGLWLTRAEYETLAPAKVRGRAGSQSSTPPDYGVREPGTEWPYDGAWVLDSPYPTCYP
jgi:Phage protein Gp19/Gp15/Gp42